MEAQMILERLGLTLEDLRGRSRRSYLCDARIIFSECMIEEGHSAKEVAIMLARDRTTIIYYHRVALGRMKYDRIYKLLMSKINESEDSVHK
jgi:hypothetical protein